MADLRLQYDHQEGRVAARHELDAQGSINIASSEHYLQSSLESHNVIDWPHCSLNHEWRHSNRDQLKTAMPNAYGTLCRLDPSSAHSGASEVDLHLMPAVLGIASMENDEVKYAIMIAPTALMATLGWTCIIPSLMFDRPDTENLADLQVMAWVLRWSYPIGLVTLVISHVLAQLAGEKIMWLNWVVFLACAGVVVLFGMRAGMRWS